MTELDRIGTQNSPARTADRIGQATAVEQARAVAEVQAAIVVAQQCPRDVQAARLAMLDSCAQMYVAERAFFRFPRAGQQVSGPSIHLARELARSWGNIQYGIDELRRDAEQGSSEMKAWAWDVQTNTRSSYTFIVPHKRDTKNGPAALVDLRDIYENNANNGARRVREAIFGVLPPWFVQEAQDVCNKTLRDGGGVPLAQRVDKAIDAFSKLGVSQVQLETRNGKKAGAWDERDVAQLLVIFQSLQRGEVNKEDEFPTERVTAGEITEGAKAAPAKATPAKAAPANANGAAKTSEPPAAAPEQPTADDATQQPPAADADATGVQVEDPPYDAEDPWAGIEVAQPADA